MGKIKKVPGKGKLKIAAALFFAALLGACCFGLHRAGCSRGASLGVLSFFHWEPKAVTARRALKEKYGQDFFIWETWYDTSVGSFYASCSPQENRWVVFEAEISDDGNDYIYGDNYVESVVAADIAQKLEGDLQEFFPGCYVHVENYNMESYLSFGAPLQVSPEMYAERFPAENFGVDICVDISELQQDTIEEEYRYFSETLQEQMELGNLPDLTIGIYYMNAKQIQSVKQHFRTHSHAYYQGHDISSSFDFGFGYPNGYVNKTYEKYEKFRTGGN